MIAETARIHPKAQLGKDVEIGEYVVIHENVKIGDNCTIQDHCVLGVKGPRTSEPLVLGSGAIVRSHSVLYAGSVIDECLSTGHHVVIREKSQIGRHCQIGSYSELQGDLVFGDYSRTQSSVFIPKHSKIGKAVWLLPRVTLTNDPHPPSDPGDLGVCISDYAVLAACSTVLPGVTIGSGALVAANSLVTRDVEPDTVVAGVPAKKRGLTREIMLRDGSGRSAYPWMRHFHRGYPEELVNSWIAEYGNNDNDN